MMTAIPSAVNPVFLSQKILIGNCFFKIIYPQLWYKFVATVKQYEKAIDDYSKAIALKPNDLMVCFNRGVTYIQLEQYEKTIKDCNKMLGLEPRYFRVHCIRGIAYKGLGQYKKAIKDYNKAIKLDSNDFLAYLYRGEIYGELN